MRASRVAIQKGARLKLARIPTNEISLPASDN